MKVLQIATERREQLVDVTEYVDRTITGLGMGGGTCVVYSPHTTCAVTVNEGWDPDVERDALRHLRDTIPVDASWAHAEGNSDAHIKTMLVGPSVTLPVSEGRLRLGRWQKVFLCEFDGPRTRELWLTVSRGE